MTDNELIYTIALTTLNYNNARKIRLLVDHYGSAEEAWKHAPEGANAAIQHAQKEVEFIHQHQIRLYNINEANYPSRLKECPDAPLLLFGKGNLQVNEGKFVSIVGTRSASERGKDLTRQLVLDLAARIPNLTIVSGLAYGIDIAAHRAALEAGIPTIIIPAHGLDRIYPTIHRSVAIDALQQGGILTEYPSGTEPAQFNFVARNRIIAGLADAVVVTESKQRGGSLITAQLAVDYNRSLFAFPGRPNDLNSIGCNELIRDQKAALIESAEDLIECMQWETAKKTAQSVEIPHLFDQLTESENKIMHLIQQQEDGIHINTLIAESGMAYAQVAAILMTLEMNGLTATMAGGMYRAKGI